MNLYKMLRNICQYVLSLLSVTILGWASAEALPLSYYADASRLSSGKWVKVKVSQTGMQEITDDELRAMGFEDPSKVAVYGYSGAELASWELKETQPEDLPAVPVAHYGDKLVFYGVATEIPSVYLRSSTYPQRFITKVVRNLYDTDSYYYLTDTAPAQEVEVSATPQVEQLAVITRGYGYLCRNYADYKLGACGVYSFSPDFSTSGVMEIELEMPGYSRLNQEAAVLNYGMGANIEVGQVKISGPGMTTVSQSLPSYTASSTPSYLMYYYKSADVILTNMSQTDDDIYPIKFDATNVSNRKGLAMDFYAVAYPRTNEFAGVTQQNVAFPTLQIGQGVALQDAPADVEVWSVGIGGVKSLKVSTIDGDGTPGFVCPRSTDATLSSPAFQTIVFSPSQTLHKVEVVGDVASQDLHGMSVPEMLVVSSPRMMSYAERLAGIHREKTGVDVAVVSYEDVCNEFSSGVSHPMAIRRLAKMLYDRDPEKFKALLIFGKPYHDVTGNMSTLDKQSFRDTYIPLLECEDLSRCGERPKSYATDAIYGMLEDDFVFDNDMKEGHFLRAPMSIMVGRIPVAEEADAVTYLSKMEKYLDQPHDKPLYNRAIMTADKGDGNLHFSQALEIRDLTRELSPSTMVDMFVQSVYNPSKGSNLILRPHMVGQLQRGAALWYFLGHSGGTQSFGGGKLWDKPYDEKCLNDNPPFTVFGTCEILGMDQNGTSLQESMLYNPTGGMIVGVGAIRPTYAEWNHYLCLLVARGYYTQKGKATFGAVYRDARNYYARTPEILGSNLGSSQTCAVNLMCYNFAGDPMLPMFLPENTVRITSWNGSPIAANLEVEPLASHTIAGEVYTADGDVDSSFNGVLTILVYDGDHTVNSSATADASNPLVEIDLDESMLQEVKIDVVNGRFSADVAFAVPTYDGAGNRVTLYAVDSERDITAIGYLDGLKINQEPDIDITDIPSPEITSMYAAGEDFEENDCLPGSFMLYADIAPSDVALLGISDRLGGGLSLTVDGSQNIKGIDGYLTVNTDGSASLACPLSEITDGPHQLTLKVVNIAGKSAQRSVNVNVVNVNLAQTEVAESFVRDEAVISLRHDLADEPEGRLVIERPDGTVVFSAADATFPYSWNLEDNAGQPVEDGVYTAKVYFQAGRRYGFAEPVSITVGR